MMLAGNPRDKDFYCGDSSELTEAEWVTMGQVCFHHDSDCDCCRFQSDDDRASHMITMVITIIIMIDHRHHWILAQPFCSLLPFTIMVMITGLATPIMIIIIVTISKSCTEIDCATRAV